MEISQFLFKGLVSNVVNGLNNLSVTEQLEGEWEEVLCTMQLVYLNALCILLLAAINSCATDLLYKEFAYE